jgi:cytochrome c biogenesis protein CcmG/thiol:disulfide interchange protein DsbE
LAAVRPNRGLGALTAALLLTASLLIGGCGADDDDLDGSHPDYAEALAGSPPALAALHRQANELLPGGEEAVEQRVAELRGYPVVVNVWASWCGPCRAEFPILQELSAKYGKRVAFLGVNSQDNDDAARTFLEEAPVPYPSYSDPDADVQDTLAARGLPDTVYYDSSGELCHVKLGQYAEHADLEEDVRAFALREECDSG